MDFLGLSIDWSRETSSPTLLVDGNVLLLVALTVALAWLILRPR